MIPRPNSKSGGKKRRRPGVGAMEPGHSPAWNLPHANQLPTPARRATKALSYIHRF